MSSSVTPSPCVDRDRPGVGSSGVPVEDSPVHSVLGGARRVNRSRYRLRDGEQKSCKCVPSQSFLSVRRRDPPFPFHLFDRGWSGVTPCLCPPTLVVSDPEVSRGDLRGLPHPPVNNGLETGTPSRLPETTGGLPHPRKSSVLIFQINIS